MPGDIFNLERFVEAQKPNYSEILGELLYGQNRTHWMWFVFPQIAGLASSETARYFAITCLDEAKAYLSHPILGERLLECTKVVNQLKERTANQIFGSPDDLKFRSCMTLFELVAGRESEFSKAIEKYYCGQRDIATLKLVNKEVDS